MAASLAASFLALQAIAVAPAGAAPVRSAQGEMKLNAAHPVVRFSGTFENPTPLPGLSNPDPTICIYQCQEWQLQVNTTRQFLVAIRNTNHSTNDGLNLYIYDPAGQQVGSSAGVGSDGQAVAVTPTTKGQYRIVVTETYQYDPEVVYLGEARIMAPPSWNTPRCGGPCPLLPRLRPLPPTEFHVDGIPPAASTPLGFPFPVDIPTGNSCYVDETLTSGATRCLRFTSDVGNVGVGVLHVRIGLISSDGHSAVVPDQCESTQIVTRADGTTFARPAGSCLFHASHAHFHYYDFVSFGLYQVLEDGTTGPLVGRALKESFCLADDGYFGFGTPGPNGPRNYPGQPGCSLPSGVDPSGASIDMGVTPGWSDIYTWDTPSQYIDITDVPPGTYDVITETNPDGSLLVDGPAHVCAKSRITLTPTSVEELGTASDIACP